MLRLAVADGSVKWGGRELEAVEEEEMVHRRSERAAPSSLLYYLHTHVAPGSAKSSYVVF